MAKDPSFIKKLLQERSLPKEMLKWITSRHMLEFFGISATTLRNWRIARRVTYTKYCGIFLYDAYEIMEEMEMAVVRRKR